jgi:hypothetical protein
MMSKHCAAIVGSFPWTSNRMRSIGSLRVSRTRCSAALGVDLEHLRDAVLADQLLERRGGHELHAVPGALGLARLDPPAGADRGEVRVPRGRPERDLPRRPVHHHPLDDGEPAIGAQLLGEGRLRLDRDDLAAGGEHRPGVDPDVCPDIQAQIATFDEEGVELLGSGRLCGHFHARTVATTQAARTPASSGQIIAPSGVHAASRDV